ncbi:XdhC family protein [Knoellia sp. CPCC 206453]|uniref:XdhC family protein n=1 Tax=Knoellia pratensis TaxID=3404796 RepID=UPI003607C72F
MREVLDDVVGWWAVGEPVGLATVVRTSGSTPRQPGAVMAVRSGAVGHAVVRGSVSGGCVESAVYELTQQVVATGDPVLQQYGVEDEDAMAVGLTCGGAIEVYVERVDQRSFPELGDVAASVRAGSPVAIATCVAGPPHRRGRRLTVWPDDVRGSLGTRRLDDAATEDVRGFLAAGISATLHYGADGERRGDELTLFITSFTPPPRMLIFGAIDFAAATARMGAFLGFHVTVCDARGVFATTERFPGAHEVVVDWPHRYLRGEIDSGLVDARTVVCVLTHDPRFDVPVLEIALRADLGYVGAMGSRRTHDERLKRLREVGVTEPDLRRLHSPIGMDIGARTPEETAVSIASEVIAARWGGTGRHLSDSEGRIHAGILPLQVVHT